MAQHCDWCEVRLGYVITLFWISFFDGLRVVAMVILAIWGGCVRGHDEIVLVRDRIG